MIAAWLDATPAKKDDGMSAAMKPAGALALAEMKEFAGFAAATQRYVRRSLDIGLDREDALERWSRDVVEAASIRAQYRLYDRLPDLRATIPADSGIDGVEPFLGQLVTLSAFDLAQGRLTSFSAIASCMSASSGRRCGPGCPRHFARRQQCRTCCRTCADACCNRLAKRPRPRRDGQRANPPFSPIGSKKSIAQRYTKARSTEAKRASAAPASM